MLSGIQVRMARAGLGWSSNELAAKADVSPTTLLKFEAGGGVHSTTIQKLETVLRQAGISFLEDDGSGPGVRVRN